MRTTIYQCDWCKEETKEEAINPGLPIGWNRVAGEKTGNGGEICGICNDKLQAAKQNAFGKVREERVKYGKLKQKRNI